MRRRTACLGLATLPVLPIARQARAQQLRKGRVAWVSIERANPESPFLLSFREGLRAHGWIEGQNVTLDTWWADNSRERLQALIPEIARSRPDVLVVASGLAVRPMIDANLPPPIVFVVSADVVLSKVVDSWVRPGVNRTGISLFSLELVGKRLQLMKELLPRLRRLAMVGWPPHAGELLELDAARKAADRLDLHHRYLGVNSAEELEAAFKEIVNWKADAVLVFWGAIAAAHAERFAEFGTRQLIPATSAWATFAERGNLMSYGPSLKETYTRLASFVDRLLKGGKAAEMPVELPTQFEFVINLKTAKVLGIDLPRAVLARADRLIE